MAQGLSLFTKRNISFVDSSNLNVYFSWRSNQEHSFHSKRFKMEKRKRRYAIVVTRLKVFLYFKKGFCFLPISKWGTVSFDYSTIISHICTYACLCTLDLGDLGLGQENNVFCSGLSDKSCYWTILVVLIHLKSLYIEPNLL